MLDKYFQGWQTLCVDTIPLDLYQKALKRYAQLYGALPEPDGPNWVHFDYRPGNV